MTIAHTTKLSALAVALLVAAATLLMPPTTASADAGAFTVAGTAHLSQGIGAIGDPPGCFAGVATGLHGTTPLAATPAYAGFTYNNPDTIEGDATGKLKTTGVEVNFDWERTGAVAIIELSGTHSGVGVAAFAPVEADLFACNGKSNDNYAHGSWSGEEHAQVVGAGVIS